MARLEGLRNHQFDKTILFASLILLPINGFFLGAYNELLFEMGAFPYLIAFPFMVMYSFKEQHSLTGIQKIFTFLIIWMIISGLINAGSILQDFHKNTPGSTRFITQMILVFIGYTIVRFVSTVISKKNIDLDTISKYVILSAQASVIVGMIEILGKILHIGLFLQLFDLISSIFNSGIFYDDRIHSLSGEPSWFGIYSAFAFPFVLHRAVEYKKNRILLYLFMLTIYFTLSRTMYFITLLQVASYVLLTFRKNLNFKNVGTTFMVIPLVSFIMFTNPVVMQNTVNTITDTLLSTVDFSKDSDESYSSLARLGMQTTAMNMGLANPVFGVGEGQFMYHFKDHVPNWALASYEIQQSMKPNTKVWPQAHGMYARLFAELGIIGLAAWVGLWFYSLVKVFQVRRMYPESEEVTRDYPILICILIGAFSTGFNVDSFRVTVIWLTLGVISGWLLRHQQRLTDTKVI